MAGESDVGAFRSRGAMLPAMDDINRGIELSPPDARSGRCAIVGRPNVGKSTLLNALLQQKLVIATSKPGTTRSSVLGVYVDDTPTQIAFVDTPGLHRPKSELGKVLVEQARLGLSDSDVALFVVEPPWAKGEELSNSDLSVLSMLREAGCPVILVINKIDVLKQKEWLLPFIESATKQHEFATVVPISALKRKQLDVLIGEIRSRLPEGLIYDAEMLTDRSERFFVAELVREAAIRHTRAEVPHGVACVVEEFTREDGLVRIHVTLVVEKDSHKGIVIGKKGGMIKKIGTAARREIERLVDSQVFLKLFVRVEPGWTGDARRAKKLATETEYS